MADFNPVTWGLAVRTHEQFGDQGLQPTWASLGDKTTDISCDFLRFVPLLPRPGTILNELADILQEGVH